MDKYKEYRKAIVAFLTPLVLALITGYASSEGIDLSEASAAELAALIAAALATGVLVFLVPNKQAEVKKDASKHRKKTA